MSLYDLPCRHCLAWDLVQIGCSVSSATWRVQANYTFEIYSVFFHSKVESVLLLAPHIVRQKLEAPSLLYWWQIVYPMDLEGLFFIVYFYLLVLFCFVFHLYCDVTFTVLYVIMNLSKFTKFKSSIFIFSLFLFLLTHIFFRFSFLLFSCFAIIYSQIFSP